MMSRISLVIMALVFCCLTGASEAVAAPSIQINLETGQEGNVVNFIIADGQARKLGRDPISKKLYDDMPGSYGTESIGEIFTKTAFFVPADGTYTIEVIGTELMEYSLSIGIFRDTVGIKRMESLDSFGVIDAGLTSTFKLTYNSDPSKPAGTALVRMADHSTLKQDITLSRKIIWIDNDGIMKSLLSKADAIDAAIARGNKAAAINQLEAFLNEVAAQKGKHLTDEAARMLTEDAEYLIKTLK